ncbi:MAG TPA: sucrase ferredoxin [Nocardioides sp.]
MADPGFRCATEALGRGDDLAGTASTVRSFLLLEHDGPWGVDALRDARLPAGLGHELESRAKRAGVRPLLVRHPGRGRRRADPPSRAVRVFAARAAGPGSWLETAVLDRVEDVLDLDLAALGAGTSPGLERVAGPLLAVCTHGRHDACCAELGRPVVRKLAHDWPDLTWEVSHMGGDRFAGNLLVLPHGLYYGRLATHSAELVGRATVDGRVVVAHLRGRSDLPMPVQAAEVELRRRLGETRRDAVVPLDHRRDGDRVTAAFEVDGDRHEVVVRVARSEPALLTCRAGAPSPAWLFEPL